MTHGPRPMLLIDIGNTRLKWAWVPVPVATPVLPGTEPVAPVPTPWRQGGAVPHGDTAALPDVWRELLGSESQREHPAPAIWISNVAGAAAAAAVQALLDAAFGPAGPTGRGTAPVVATWVATASSCAGLRNGYRNPRQLGVDRWTGAVGAHRHRPADNLMIVTAGTATTVDIVTAARGDGAAGVTGTFEGGMILPGLDLMMASLARNTAQLPAVRDVEAGIAALGAGRADNTLDAIAAGCLAAQAGAIERAWRTLSARGPARCLLSGGARDTLARVLPFPFELHDNLVLLGLAVMGSTAPTDAAHAPATEAAP